ncbi:hypothetical protein A0128_19145 [Leptospira tipperaryensis]|uniref:Uncharacterized protein n=1 Tax=Leptospira tipperaryensis TaxID=2564040 RepID=A0A1D7V1R6_9LEPT|nr:hypothetical protein [Leptospira tipperaryensis]AOP35769.1 hypothetical protein A0128_19145 [Leptospira tipperaryensis]
MSQITGFFSDLKTSFDSLSQSIQSFLETVGVITSFLKILFSIVPLDLFLVLIFSLILVFLFNTISPSTSRFNYTLGVAIVSVLRSFFHHSISQTWNLGPVLLTAFYLLMPAYFFFLLRIGFVFLKKFYQRKKSIHPNDLESALANVQKSFQNLMANGYAKLYVSDSKTISDPNSLKEHIEEMERTVQGLKNILNSKKE